MSTNRVNPDNSSIDTAIRAFARKRRNQRISLTLLLVGVLTAVVAILAYASYRAKQAEKQAKQAELQATRATQTLDSVANDTLARVQEIDRRAKQLCDCEDPTAYLWRGGLHPQKEKPGQVDPELITLLQQRKNLLGSAGALLGVSKGLRAYVCDHNFSVVGESKPKSEAEEYLNMQRARDPRFLFAENFGGPLNPSWSGVMVGFFLSSPEVKVLQKEIGVNRSDAHPWYSCPGTGM